MATADVLPVRGDWTLFQPDGDLVTTSSTTSADPCTFGDDSYICGVPVLDPDSPDECVDMGWWFALHGIQKLFAIGGNTAAAFGLVTPRAASWFETGTTRFGRIDRTALCTQTALEQVDDLTGDPGVTQGES